MAYCLGLSTGMAYSSFSEWQCPDMSPRAQPMISLYACVGTLAWKSMRAGSTPKAFKHIYKGIEVDGSARRPYCRYKDMPLTGLFVPGFSQTFKQLPGMSECMTGDKSAINIFFSCLLSCIHHMIITFFQLCCSVTQTYFHVKMFVSISLPLQIRPPLALRWSPPFSPQMKLLIMCNYKLSSFFSNLLIFVLFFSH